MLEAAASDGYDLVITCDQGISNEQNLNRYYVTLITIMGGDWTIIRENIDVIRRSLETASRGEANRMQMIAEARASVSPNTRAAKSSQYLDFMKQERDTMPLLNYSTKVPAEQTVMEITRLLVKHGATDIITSYGEEGEPRGLKWRLTTPHGPLAFALPCNVPQVFHLLTQDRIHVRDVEARRKQATRVAWRILKDWIEAQLALLDTGMVELEEIFLPYMLQGDQTLYQALQAGNFKALQSG